MAELPVGQGPAAPTPTIVVICGSMRFFAQMLEVAADETAKGHIVLAPFSVVAPEDRGSEFKAMLDELHRRKIDMADRVVIVTDQDGYVGTSTRAEMVYAAQQGMTWDVREFEIPPVTAVGSDPVPPLWWSSSLGMVIEEGEEGHWMFRMGSGGWYEMRELPPDAVRLVAAPDPERRDER